MLVLGETQQGKAAIDAEFFVDMMQVNLDGAFTDEQFVGDLLGRTKALCYHPDEVDLPCSQETCHLAARIKKCKFVTTRL